MNLKGVTVGFWHNLSQSEQHELAMIQSKVKRWIMYVEDCRKGKIPIDYSKAVSDEDYIRGDVLRNKFFEPYNRGWTKL